MYSLSWGFVDIYFWKGTWDGVNCIFGKSYIVACVTFFGAMSALICVKSLKSASSLPVGLVVDDIANLCHASTFFQTKVMFTYIKINLNAFHWQPILFHLFFL